MNIKWLEQAMLTWWRWIEWSTVWMDPDEEVTTLKDIVTELEFEVKLLKDKINRLEKRRKIT